MFFTVYPPNQNNQIIHDYEQFTETTLWASTVDWKKIDRDSYIEIESIGQKLLDKGHISYIK